MSQGGGPDRQERIKRWLHAQRPLIAPSLLACDFSRMDSVLLELAALGLAGAHLDVMDGHFVPNLSYGPPVIRRWREAASLFFDAHLMISDPERYLDDYLEAGCDQITFHIEAVPQPASLLSKISQAGCLPGLSLNPPTPVSTVLPYLDQVSSILVMSVMPGFGGQEFQAAVLDKVRTIRQARPDLDIAIDGGLNPHTITRAVEAGVTQIVAGSAVFQSPGGVPVALSTLAEAARVNSARNRPSP